MREYASTRPLRRALRVAGGESEPADRTTAQQVGQGGRLTNPRPRRSRRSLRSGLQIALPALFVQVLPQYLLSLARPTPSLHWPSAITCDKAARPVLGQRTLQRDRAKFNAQNLYHLTPPREEPATFSKSEMRIQLGYGRFASLRNPLQRMNSHS